MHGAFHKVVYPVLTSGGASHEAMPSFIPPFLLIRSINNFLAYLDIRVPVTSFRPENDVLVFHIGTNFIPYRLHMHRYIEVG